MEQFGWTEEELYHQNSMYRIQLISGYNNAKNQGEKWREKQGNTKPGTIYR